MRKAQGGAAFIAVSVTIMVGLLQAPPAQAQYFGYSPFTGASNWGWLARNLMYPLNRASGYNAPYYLANSLVWNGAYAATRGMNGRQYQAGQQVDPSGQPVLSPRTRNKPFLSGPAGVSDQSVQAQWVPPAKPLPQDQQIAPQLNGWVPVGQTAFDPAPGVAPMDPNDPFAPAQNPSTSPVFAPQSVASAPYAIPSGMPPQATQSVDSSQSEQSVPTKGKKHVRKDKHARDQSNNANLASAGRPIGQFGAPPTGSSPLVRGFIHLVNANYNGNIAQALNDPDMRRYAGAIGLIADNQPLGEINQQRAELVRQIFAEEGQDPAVRVNAAKMLLKPAVNQSAATGIPR